eukprot:Skav207369  [mRNA]  locus=scaffold3618:71547:71852:- [translate_table: standard]
MLRSIPFKQLLMLVLRQRPLWNFADKILSHWMSPCEETCLITRAHAISGLLRSIRGNVPSEFLWMSGVSHHPGLWNLQLWSAEDRFLGTFWAGNELGKGWD